MTPQIMGTIRGQNGSHDVSKRQEICQISMFIFRQKWDSALVIPTGRTVTQQYYTEHETAVYGRMLCKKQFSRLHRDMTADTALGMHHH
jgi:hypothetical protein